MILDLAVSLFEMGVLRCRSDMSDRQPQVEERMQKSEPHNFMWKPLQPQSRVLPQKNAMNP